SATAELARFASALSLADVPVPVVGAVKRLVLDHLGCALGGSRTPLARAAADVAVADRGGGATGIGTRRRAPPGPPAFANGAAAAAARLLGLGYEEMLCAFGLAGAFAPLPHEAKFGWNEDQLSWVKDNVAWPAEGGVRAALLAASGFRATRTILDGDRGLWRMLGSDRCDFDRMVHDLGTDWELLRVSL